MRELEIRHLRKTFRDRDAKTVLDDVSLEVDKGDVYGILGLSGAGKSTLVRCINGLESFDEGEIYFQGRLLASPKQSASAEDRRKIQMIFQSFNLLHQRTVLGNVTLPLELDKGIGKAERLAKAKQCLELVGMAEYADAYPATLSGGQKQRVAIARALTLDPEILLSDEATSALDPETTKTILALLKKLNKELGLTVIMISHQMNVIEDICNKVAILDAAKVAESGTFREVFLHPRTEIAKKLVYAESIVSGLQGEGVRLLFDGNVDEPILSGIVTECGIPVSVAYASTKNIEGRVYGQLVIAAPQKEDEKVKLYAYLAKKGVAYEEVRR